MRVVVIGAGVAGCVITRTLSRIPGIDIVCLERVAEDDHSESGTGLNIGPNAVQALRSHDPELERAITNASLPWRNWRVSLTDGTVLFDLPLANVADNDGWRIRWSELYRVLRKAAGDAVRYDCTIDDVGHSGSGKTFVSWTQGGTSHRIEDIDLLIAGDGRYSQIRNTLSGKPPETFVGVAISRVLVPNTSAGLIDDYEQWFNGPNRLLAFRVPPDHIYVASAFPIGPGEPIPDRLKQPDALRRAFTPETRPPSDQARWLIDTICKHAAATHWARMQTQDVLIADPRSNVLYLGDASHAMVPTLGQGATQAIEGAATAGELILREWSEGRRDPRHWLKAIENLRSERIRFAMELSLQATDTMLDGADPVAGTLHKTEPEFLAKLGRLYRDTPALGSAKRGFSKG